MDPWIHGSAAGAAARAAAGAAAGASASAAAVCTHHVILGRRFVHDKVHTVAAEAAAPAGDPNPCTLYPRIYIFHRES